MKLHMIIFLYLLPVLLIAQPSPDFMIIDATDGQEYHLYEDFLDQGKTVVLDVFFTSCPPCNAAAPFLEPLYQEWGAGLLDVEFIALSDKSFDSNEDVAAYQVNKGHSFLGAGNDGLGREAANLFKTGTYGVWLGTPTYIVIEPDGTVHFDIRSNSIQNTIELLDETIATTGAARARRATGRVLFDGRGVGEASVFLENDEHTASLTDSIGQFMVNKVILPNENYTLQVEKDINHSNGVSSLDMILILKHILNRERFDSPLQYIAADVNRSNSITSLDIVKIRKVILGLDETFINNTSWRFIPAGVTFEQPGQPFEEFDLLEATGFSFDYEDDFSNIQINGVKIGDVNFSADAELALMVENDNRTDFKSKSSVLEFLEVQVKPNPVDNWVELSYHLFANDKLTLSIFDINGQEVRQIVIGEQQSGQQIYRFGMYDLETGVYIIRIEGIVSGTKSIQVFKI